MLPDIFDTQLQITYLMLNQIFKWMNGMLFNFHFTKKAISGLPKAIISIN